MARLIPVQVTRGYTIKVPIKTPVSDAFDTGFDNGFAYARWQANKAWAKRAYIILAIALPVGLLIGFALNVALHRD